MDTKEEFRLLIKTIKNNGIAAGVKFRNEDIAKRLGYNTDYFSTLTGKSGIVTQGHIEDVKAIFKNELAGVIAGDAMNPERAILLSLLEDYTEWKAEQTGATFEEVKAELKKRGSRILSGFDTWLPDAK